jgi:hypothetical protein
MEVKKQDTGINHSNLNKRGRRVRNDFPNPSPTQTLFILILFELLKR